MASLKPKTIEAFHDAQAVDDRLICELLCAEIDRHLPEAKRKIWHAHPVWFLDDNPIVGYSKLKTCVRLMFWSGQSFKAPGLLASGTFKAAEMRYTHVDEIDRAALKLWTEDARVIQWDYKNIYKRKGRLERLL